MGPRPAMSAGSTGEPLAGGFLLASSDPLTDLVAVSLVLVHKSSLCGPE